MAYAAVGANFQGLVWRGHKHAVPWANQLRNMESDLRRYASELGTSIPVGWVKAKNAKPYSAICSENTLFVVLLHPSYLDGFGTIKTLKLPLNDEPQRAQIEILPPPSISIGSGHRISGGAIRIESKDGTLDVDCVFAGGGEILVFPISRGVGREPDLTRAGTVISVAEE